MQRRQDRGPRCATYPRIITMQVSSIGGAGSIRLGRMAPQVQVKVSIANLILFPTLEQRDFYATFAPVRQCIRCEELQSVTDN